MPGVVTYSMLLLSATATVASLIFFVVYFDANVESVMGVIKTLFAIMFILVILTQHLTVKLVPNLRDRLLSKGVFRGCPRWMRIGARVFWVSVWFASLILTFGGRRLGGFFVMFAGLYSMSFCVTYSFLHAEPVARSDSK
jgi:hypothetical protein